jgi:hypothetical protein
LIIEYIDLGTKVSPTNLRDLGADVFAGNLGADVFIINKRKGASVTNLGRL